MQLDPNEQFMWTGLLREQAQQWADERGLHTLSTAMGPLMTKEHVLCCKNKKPTKGWSQYVKGASALFAGFITFEETVTVLSPSPPERFHPSGQTNYQTIEELILRAGGKDGSGIRIEMVHPLVKGAEDFRYQLWPIDETYRWINKFGSRTEKRNWRSVKGFPSIKPTPRHRIPTGQNTSKNNDDPARSNTPKRKDTASLNTALCRSAGGNAPEMLRTAEEEKEEAEEEAGEEEVGEEEAGEEEAGEEEAGEGEAEEEGEEEEEEER